MTKEGTVLDGKYEIWKEVGRGGMSIVYLARDNRLNKQWAVKEIKNESNKATATLLKGLEREANILKNVDHPVLPRIVDILNQDGTIYVVMDFIEGTTLSERLKREGAQPQELVIEWGLQLASALDYLHNMNPPIIYRDMKPSNVMIKPEGGVKLIDFGTAKEYEIENNADTTALGTRGYAAPEQFGDSKGRGIYNTDARTDIYNLGATLYHVVTGMNPCEPPYEMRPIREWNPSLSSGLEKIILKCTQPNPEDRYQNCGELMYALEHYDELDDEYHKHNKIKMAIFGVAAVLTFAAAGTSFYGYTKLKEVEAYDYNAYIENGDYDRIEGDYGLAAEQYKKAFLLKSSDTSAYEKFIQVYIEGHNIKDSEGNSLLDLESGLTVVANRIKSDYGKLSKNNTVLYKLAMAYFVELSDYKSALNYFDMIDESNETYGELAKYYKSVCMILSSTNINEKELLKEVDSFAKYNATNFSNQDEDKFINYKIIGRIYATYANVGDTALKAKDIMSGAITDLDEYTGTQIMQNDYFFAYYDNMISIYETIVKSTNNVDEGRDLYIVDALNCCDEYLNILNIKAEDSENMKIGGTNDNIYNTSYYNKIMKKIYFYNEQNDFEMVENTYQEAEAVLGTENTLSSKLYANHLDYIYSRCEKISHDPSRWGTECASELDKLTTVYEAGKTISDINSNKTWKKRKDVMEMLEGYQVSQPHNDEIEDSQNDDSVEEKNEN